MSYIYIDADSAGHVKEVERIAAAYNVPVILYCNGDHLITSEYSDVRYVEKGKDKADFAIVKNCRREDIVITRDYGLAAMAIAKHATVFHPNGAQYTDQNLEQLLFKRYCGLTYGRKSKKKAIRVPNFKGIGISNALKSVLENVIQ